MRKLRNVLYVTNPNSYLSRDGESVTICVDQSEVARIPIHNLEGIVCFGYMGASPALMELCQERDVGMSFVSPYGKYLARVGGKVSGNVLLRKKQYSVSDDRDEAAKIAKNFILGKLLNCRSVLLRFSRDYPGEVERGFQDRLDRLSDGIDRLKESCLPLNELRGMEGLLSKYYFECLDDLILSRDPVFSFTGRSRRPPLDPVRPRDFVVKENGAVLLTDEARKTVLQAWQKRKQEEIMYPFLDEKIPLGLLPYAQAILLARYLRGDTDGYPPFLMR